jgi:hypothetical protein
LNNAKAGAIRAWTVVCISQCRPWTCSIKPSLKHFQFCRFGLSLGILIFSICSLSKLKSILGICIFIYYMLRVQSDVTYPEKSSEVIYFTLFQQFLMEKCVSLVKGKMCNSCYIFSLIVLFFQCVENKVSFHKIL